MTKKAIKNKIHGIATQSTRFKIGKTGQTLEDRLDDYSNFRKIEGITQSKKKSSINELEADMINEFCNYRNNENDIGESTGKMTDETGKYKLYVVYQERRK